MSEGKKDLLQELDPDIKAAINKTPADFEIVAKRLKYIRENYLEESTDPDGAKGPDLAVENAQKKFLHEELEKVTQSRLAKVRNTEKHPSQEELSQIKTSDDLLGYLMRNNRSLGIIDYHHAGIHRFITGKLELLKQNGLEDVRLEFPPSEYQEAIDELLRTGSEKKIKEARAPRMGEGVKQDIIELCHEARRLRISVTCYDKQSSATSGSNLRISATNILWADELAISEKKSIFIAGGGHLIGTRSQFNPLPGFVDDLVGNMPTVMFSAKGDDGFDKSNNPDICDWVIRPKELRRNTEFFIYESIYLNKQFSNEEVLLRSIDECIHEESKDYFQRMYDGLKLMEYDGTASPKVVEEKTVSMSPTQLSVPIVGNNRMIS